MGRRMVSPRVLRRRHAARLGAAATSAASIRSRSRGPCSPARPTRSARARRWTSVDEHLIRRDDGLALLFTPPFDQAPHDPGYIKGYPPGAARERRPVQRTRAIWAVLAFARLGSGDDRAVELFTMLNPINHTRSQADVDPLQGRAVCRCGRCLLGRAACRARRLDLVHGLRGWMYRAGIEGILGIVREATCSSSIHASRRVGRASRPVSTSTRRVMRSSCGDALPATRRQRMRSSTASRSSASVRQSARRSMVASTSCTLRCSAARGRFAIARSRRRNVIRREPAGVLRQLKKPLFQGRPTRQATARSRNLRVFSSPRYFRIRKNVRPAASIAPARELSDSAGANCRSSVRAAHARARGPRPAARACCTARYERNLLDADALSMIEGVLQVSELSRARHHGAARADGRDRHRRSPPTNSSRSCSTPRTRAFR